LLLFSLYAPALVAGVISNQGVYMEALTKIPPEIAALIPAVQLRVTKENLSLYSGVIMRLKKQLEKCPKIGETGKKKEHPAIFHYFFYRTDFFVCEYDRKDLMFGYSILNGDLHNSEWGYISLSEITKIPVLSLDYHLQDQSIETALHKLYPKHFKKPPSVTA
jgi:hypothetical protein